VPYRNRVTPDGDLIAVEARGTLTGNRGVLHDERGEIVRRGQVRRWITCRLEFRGRYREVMMPGRYTHLFFLDEATALAAGHRPCAECRHADHRRFRDCWAAAAGDPEHPPGADAMDAVLARERARADGRRRTVPEPAAGLPDGVMVSGSDGPWLVLAGALWRWTPAGYTDRRPLPRGTLDVLTPPATLAAVRAGYRPVVHPSAGHPRT
jgi:hypothetical protein